MSFEELERLLVEHGLEALVEPLRRAQETEAERMLRGRVRHRAAEDAFTFVASAAAARVRETYAESYERTSVVDW